MRFHLQAKHLWFLNCARQVDAIDRLSRFQVDLPNNTDLMSIKPAHSRNAIQ